MEFLQVYKLEARKKRAEKSLGCLYRQVNKQIGFARKTVKTLIPVYEQQQLQLQLTEIAM